MAYLDVLGQLTIRDGDDHRQFTHTVSAASSVEYAAFQFSLATSTKQRIDLSLVGVTTSDRWVMVRPTQMVFISPTSAMVATHTFSVAANGIFLADIGSSPSSLWVKNRSSSSTASVEVVISAKTSV